MSFRPGWVECVSRVFAFGLPLALAFLPAPDASAQSWPPRWATRTPTATRTLAPTLTPSRTATASATPTAAGTAPALAMFGSTFLCWGCSDDALVLADLRAHGMGSARQRCTYGSPTDYACSDAVVAASNAAGVRTILVGWYKVGAGGRFGWPAGDCTNAQLADVATLYGNLATRYAGNAPPLVYQIDNEPDGCGVAQSDYVDTFVTAHDAIRAADPQALVSVAGLAYEDAGPFTTAWTVGLYAAIHRRIADPSAIRGAAHAYHSYRGRWGGGTYPYRDKLATVQAAGRAVWAGTPPPPYISMGITECGESSAWWGRDVQATAVAQCVDEIRDDPTPRWIVAPYQAREDPNNPGFGLYSETGATPYPAAQSLWERMR